MNLKVNNSICNLIYLVTILMCIPKGYSIDCQTIPLLNSSMCKICVVNNQVTSCQIFNQNTANSSQSIYKCYSTCCPNTDIFGSPSSCWNGEGDSIGSTINTATILIIIFFSIPVVLCIAMSIHACVKDNSSTRNNTNEPPISAVNLE